MKVFQWQQSNPQIMGILNATDDSFCEQSRVDSIEAAVIRAVQMQHQGVNILDIGGESTRPGAKPITAQLEIQRVVPIIQAIRNHGMTLPISIDTSKPEVMQAAVAAGANAINDVRALQMPGALPVVAELDVPVCITHMQGTPQTMQNDPVYENVVQSVYDFLQQRLAELDQAGITEVCIDPGFGFGKTLVHNQMLFQQLSRFKSIAKGLLVGVSRKRMIGSITGQVSQQNRVVGSACAALLAVQRGADIVRVHDVQATYDALAIEKNLS